MPNPFDIFRAWNTAEAERTAVRIPSACCLTTIGTDGFPNARFVSLKSVQEERLIITGPLDSRKGLEVAENPKVALAFWWTETERQVRIQGVAEPLPAERAKELFAPRNRASKVVSTVFEQGKPIGSFEEMDARFESAMEKLKHVDLEKPSAWSGFAVRPVRMEFMEFLPTRLHRRTLFQREADDWEVSYLQP